MKHDRASPPLRVRPDPRALRLLLALGAPCLVAASSASERPLTYADALRAALSGNPSLVQARAELAAAEGGLVSAKGAFDPTLNANLTSAYTRFETNMGYATGDGWQRSQQWQVGLGGFLPTGTIWSVDWNNDTRESRANYDFGAATIADRRQDAESTLTATVTQPLLEGWRLSYNLQGVRGARRALDSAQAAVAATRLEAVAQTARAYWNLDYQESLVDIAEQTLAVAEEERRIVEAQVAVGRLPTLDLSRVEAAVVQARSFLLDARNARRAASDSLAILLGESPGPLFVAVSGLFEPVAVDLDEARLTRVALEQSPSLIALRVAVENASEHVDNTRHARLPQLDAVGSYGLDGYEEGLSEAVGEMAEHSLPRWYVGARFSAPLGNRADRGAFSQARANLERSRSALSAAEASLEQAVRAQARLIESGVEKTRLAEANLRFAEATLTAEKALQREGRVIQKDLLEAERVLADAKVSLVRARMDHALAIVELGRLQGRIEGVAAGNE
jgi:outer membrane protein TolC